MVEFNVNQGLYIWNGIDDGFRTAKKNMVFKMQKQHQSQAKSCERKKNEYQAVRYTKNMQTYQKNEEKNISEYCVRTFFLYRMIKQKQMIRLSSVI